MKYKIGKFKCMELSSSIIGFGRVFFAFHMAWSRKSDHAGFNSYLQVWNWIFDFNIYDIRHWDGDNGCFEELPNPYDDPKYDGEYKDDYVPEDDNWEEQIGVGA